MREEAPSGPRKLMHVVCPAGRPIVDPPRLFVKGGETIAIKSHCRDLRGYFPDPRVVDAVAVIGDVDGEWPEDGVQRPVDPGRGFSFDIPAGKVGVVRLAPAKRLKRLLKKTGRRTKTVPPIEPGVYPFSLYCCEHADFAEGNSPPEIIIDEGP